MKYFRILSALLFSISSVVTDAPAQRTEMSINESWAFQKGDLDLEAVFDLTDKKGWTELNLPHTWNAADSRDTETYYYRGPGWYRKTLHIPDALLGQKIYLHFEAANAITEVYVNGTFAGKHEAGYTAFRFQINDYIDPQSPHDTLIAVKVDNGWFDHVSPLGGDWTFFGGIYRDVYLITTSTIHFDMDDFAGDGVYLNAPSVSEKEATLEIRARLVNSQSEAKDIIWKTELRDAQNQVVITRKRPLKLNPGLTFQHLRLPNIQSPHLWSPDSPYLYRVVNSLIDPDTGAEIDRQTIPWGFRWYAFDPKEGFFLNGQKLKLIGASRHQDFGDLGNALPDNLHEADMKLLKEMGGNFLRIAHYPQDKAVLRACDRLGILTCVEVPLVSRITPNDAFKENARFQMREMITQYRNHPSVIMWSYMNEILLSTKLGKFRKGDTLPEEILDYLGHITELAKELEAIAGEMDPDRYTMVSNVRWPDIHELVGLTNIPEVVGWNLYSGWYGDRLEVMNEFLESFHAENPDIPIMISEFGAGSDPRIRSDEPRRFDFSMEYQNLYHKHYLKAILSYDFVAGGAIWNFADFSSEPRQDAVPFINSKGVVTHDRKPKDSYFYYQAHLAKEPVIAIAPALLESIVAVEGSLTNPALREIRVYSNLNEVELIHNQQSLGTLPVSDGFASTEVLLINGTNRFLAKGTREHESVIDSRVYEVEVIPHSLASYFMQTGDFIPELRINAGAHFWYSDDTGQTWLKDQPYTEGAFGYIGGDPFTTWKGARIGTSKNIGLTSDDPIYQTQRVNPAAYRFDVPAGVYELTLGFAELLSNKELEKLAFNLGADSADEAEDPDREFTISANGRILWPQVNLANSFGEGKAIKKRFIVHVGHDEGLRVEFTSIRHSPILNAIRLKRIY